MLFPDIIGRMGSGMKYEKESKQITEGASPLKDEEFIDFINALDETPADDKALKLDAGVIASGYPDEAIGIGNEDMITTQELTAFRETILLDDILDEDLMKNEEVTDRSVPHSIPR